MQQAAIRTLQQELGAIASGAASHRGLDGPERPEAAARQPRDETRSGVEKSVRVAAPRGGGSQQRKS